MAPTTPAEKRAVLEAALGIALPPGTEVMRDVGDIKFKHASGEDTLSLVPTPSDDPHDPLNWTKAWKLASFSSMMVYVLVQCYPSLAISQWYPDLQAKFGSSAAQSAPFTGVMILLLGYANLIFVPFAVAYGRRPALNICNALGTASFIWQALAKSYGSFMGARVLNGCGACLIETIGPMVVQDLFFVHQNGRYVSWYFVGLFFSTNFGPFLASLFQGKSFASFFWMALALGIFTQVCVLLGPETLYIRKGAAVIIDPHAEGSAVDNDKKEGSTTVEPVVSAVLGHGRPAKEAWRWIPQRAPGAPTIWKAAIFPFSLFAFPIVIWASLVFTMAAASTLFASITQAILFGAGGYGFTAVQIGATNWVFMASVIFGSLGAGYLSDWDVARRTTANDSVREPEQRLPMFIPFALMLIFGTAALGISSTRGDHWAVVLFVAYFLQGVGVIGSSVIALAYALDSYPMYAGEVMLAATVIKNSMAFGLTYYGVDWCLTWGWQNAIGLWTGIIGLVVLCGVPIFFYGKKLRILSAKSWLMKDH